MTCNGTGTTTLSTVSTTSSSTSRRTDGECQFPNPPLIQCLCLTTWFKESPSFCHHVQSCKTESHAPRGLLSLRYYWEPDCFLGMKGCLADGSNVECRFCGSGDFAEAWQGNSRKLGSFGIGRHRCRCGAPGLRDVTGAPLGLRVPLEDVTCITTTTTTTTTSGAKRLENEGLQTL